MNIAKDVVLYARVSTQAQDSEDSVSIEEQLISMRELCERNGWKVVGEFVDNQNYIATKHPKRGKTVNPSGERDDRPALVAMLEVAKTGSVDALVAWRDDRLVRHPRVNVTIEDALDLGDSKRNGKGKIQIYDATGATLDRFTMAIKAAVWKEENKRRVERMKLGQLGTLKRGLWPGPYRRFGYSTEKGERGVRIVKGLEEEIKTVKDIFNWYDAGVNVVQIRKRLIAEDRPQRGQFNGGKTHQWGPPAILNILRSEDYTGKATWKYGDGTPPISIDIPQLITPEQFKRVQKRMKENQRLATRNTKGIFLLQNLAVCGGCGGNLSAGAKTRFYYKRQIDGTIKRYERQGDAGYRYYCTAAYMYPEEMHTRPFAFNGSDLDAQFWQYVAEKMVTHPELIIRQVKNRQIELKNQGNNLDSDIATKRRQIDAIDQDRMTYTRQLGRGKIKEAVYDSLMAECDENEADLREQLDNLLTLRDEQKEVRNAIAYAEKLLSDIRRRLPEINQSPEELAALPEARQREILLERQRIIRSLVDKAIVHADGNITIQGLIEVKNITSVTQSNDICN